MGYNHIVRERKGTLSKLASIGQNAKRNWQKVGFPTGERHRKWIPSDSLWANDSSFNNRYSGKWAQLDLRGTTDYSDGSGEIQMMPSTDPRCSRDDSLDTGYGTCLGVDTTSLANGEYYINPGQFRDYRGELERDNTFIFIKRVKNVKVSKNFREVFF